MMLKRFWKMLLRSRGVFLLGLIAALLVLPGYRAYGCELEITGAGKDILFSAWRVGEENQGTIVLSEKYEGYRVDFDREDRIPAGTLALEGFLQRDRVSADARAETNESVTAIFYDLPEGIYLIGRTAEENKQEKTGVIREVQPVLVSLGGSSPKERTIQAKVKTTPVPEKENGTPDKPGRSSHGNPGTSTERRTLTVRKIWEDKDGTGRPASIVIDLLEDGRIAANAVLTTENGWKASFEGLSADKAYTVAERTVPEGYVVSLDLEGNEAVLTNRLRESLPVQGTSILPSKLPQTGPVLWPILFLLPVGFLALFWGRGRKQHVCMVFGICCLSWSLCTAGAWIRDAQEADQAAAALLQEYEAAAPLTSDIDPESSRLEKEGPESGDDPASGISVSYEDPSLRLLEIPALELSLPVYSDWSYEKLRKAPCVYHEEGDGDRIILCAHNYPAHFGRIGTLSVGDTALLNTGSAHEYQVISREILNPGETGKLLDGEDWNLTLFTCTPGGAARVVVRLREVKEENS